MNKSVETIGPSLEVCANSLSAFVLEKNISIYIERVCIICFWVQKYSNSLEDNVDDRG